MTRRVAFLDWAPTRLTPLRIAILVALLLVIRSWPRLLYPSVWDEDGTRNLTGFLANGMLDLLHPVNGYLITIPKLITAVSATLSISLYPIIGTLLALGFTAFVLVSIAIADLELRGKYWLAVFPLLIPSDPETFGLPLYTLWWSGLLLFMVVFWRSPDSRPWFRGAALVLASLSSPLCVITLPVFWLRAVIRRNRTDRWLALAATVFAAIQVLSMLPLAPATGTPMAGLKAVPELFLGRYVIGSLAPAAVPVVTGILVTYIAICLYLERKSLATWILVYLWFASVALSLARINVAWIDPIVNGPRYFFYPFIVLGWLMIQFVCRMRHRWLRLAGAVMLALSVANATAHLERRHDPLEWQAHLASCANFSEYEVPVQYDGHRTTVWYVPFSGARCRAELAGDLFARWFNARQFAYSITTVATQRADEIPTFARSDAVLATTWRGADDESFINAKASVPGNVTIIGSFAGAGADTGALTVHMHRGDRLLYRTDSVSGLQRIAIVGLDDQFLTQAPAGGWLLLAFSNRRLPAEFDVRFSDDGTGAGEWSAVAFIEPH